FVHQVRDSMSAGAAWLVVEPNLLHPYVWLKQEHMRRSGVGEDHFRPRPAERAFVAAGLSIDTKRYAFLFPGWVDSLPPPLLLLEGRLERVPFLGGAVVYRLRPR